MVRERREDRDKAKTKASSTRNPQPPALPPKSPTCKEADILGSVAFPRQLCSFWALPYKEEQWRPAAYHLCCLVEKNEMQGFRV